MADGNETAPAAKTPGIEVAVLSGLFEVIRFFHAYNTLWSLVFAYTIFTLPFTVWVLTTFMRDLPIEIEIQ